MATTSDAPQAGTTTMELRNRTSAARPSHAVIAPSPLTSGIDNTSRPGCTHSGFTRRRFCRQDIAGHLSVWFGLQPPPDPELHGEQQDHHTAE